MKPDDQAHLLPPNRFLPVLKHLSRENHSDDKVCMLQEIDVSGAQRLRRRWSRQGRTGPSITALVVMAVGRALKEHPHANRLLLKSLWGHRIAQLTAQDVSVAVAMDRPGLEQVAYVETLRQVTHRDLQGLSDALRSLVERGPESSPRWQAFSRVIETYPSWLAARILALPGRSLRLWQKHRGGAVLVSSPGKYGLDALAGHWAWPLGVSFGKIKDRPWVVGGRVCVRPTMWVSLSFNRHILAGAPAARFLQTLCGYVSDPDGMRPAELLKKSGRPINERAACV